MGLDVDVTVIQRYSSEKKMHMVKVKTLNREGASPPTIL